MKKIIIVSITLFLLLFPILADSIPSKKVIKVAILRQKWDPLDVTIGDSVSNNFHKLLLKEAEARYDVKFKIYEFWDDWNGGDVQNSSLIKKHIDVAIAPGGFGFWCTPEKYRKEIRKFVPKPYWELEAHIKMETGEEIVAKHKEGKFWEIL